MLRAGLLQRKEALDVGPRRGLGGDVGWRLAHGGDGRRRLEGGEGWVLKVAAPEREDGEVGSSTILEGKP